MPSRLRVEDSRQYAVRLNGMCKLMPSLEVARRRARGIAAMNQRCRVDVVVYDRSRGEWNVVSDVEETI